jgi:hypothetical protein
MRLHRIGIRNGSLLALLKRCPRPCLKRDLSSSDRVVEILFRRYRDRRQSLLVCRVDTMPGLLSWGALAINDLNIIPGEIQHCAVACHGEIVFGSVDETVDSEYVKVS